MRSNPGYSRTYNLEKMFPIRYKDVGMRVPHQFFLTTGTGESDLGFHAGSYHLALKSAGIEMCNIMSYSSILPAIAEEVPRLENIVYGSVMETISAAANSRKGDVATAGIIYGWLHDPNSDGVYGGLVCECSEPDFFPEDAERRLRANIAELHSNGYSDLQLRNIKVIIESFIPKKEYGTAFVALCFVNYRIPIISDASPFGRSMLDLSLADFSKQI